MDIFVAIVITDNIQRISVTPTCWPHWSYCHTKIVILCYFTLHQDPNQSFIPHTAG